MAITITITITSKSVIDYTQLQLQLSITPCLPDTTICTGAALWTIKQLIHAGVCFRDLSSVVYS